MDIYRYLFYDIYDIYLWYLSLCLWKYIDTVNDMLMTSSTEEHRAIGIKGVFPVGVLMDMSWTKHDGMYQSLQALYIPILIDWLIDWLVDWLIDDYHPTYAIYPLVNVYSLLLKVAQSK